MPITDDGISKYVCFLKVACIVQFCLGMLLIICGGLTLSYTQEQSKNKDPLNYASVFVCGVLMIAAGIVSIMLQRMEDSYDIIEQGPCLVHTEHILCVFLSIFALAGFFFCAVSGLSAAMKDCEKDESETLCNDIKVRTEITTLTNMILLIATATVSIMSICCGCKYGHYFGVERQCCPVSRPARNILEDTQAKMSPR